MLDEGAYYDRGMRLIVLAGGLGTRLREETEYRPKPMVEVGGRPILWHIMRNFSEFGITEFVIATGYRGNVIRDYFLNFRSRSQDFTTNLGTGEVATMASNRSNGPCA